jgi:hypothetical protein
VDDQLRRALEPVLHDLRAAGGPLPARVEDADWADDPGTASAMLWSSDGSGMGVQVQREQPFADQVAWLADQVQEWAVEDLWGTAPTNWPPCPRHPTTHPLQVGVVSGAAWWSCPRDGVPVAQVGSLG